MDEARLRALSFGGAVAATLVLGVAFAALAAAFGTGSAAMALFVVLFVVAIAYESIYHQLEEALGRDADPDSVAEDALETLRLRYARDEITEAEFERKLETLLETETTADAERYVGAASEPDEDHEFERERW
ncbi:SHOCT domain-containing protein [Halalkalicoccus tibetensis]|uniref:SHOCT domain-containing protein n=1 Tax=Halalkalicoccus tibetensis TaxID=175632 RepID=A0ABD5V466_9EURY